MHHRRHDVGGARGAATRERAAARRHEAARGGRLAQIGAQRDGGRAASLQRAHGRAGGGRRAVVAEGDVEAGVGQAQRDRAAEAYGAAGHERAAPSLRIPARHVIVEVMKTWLKGRLIAGFFVTVPAVATAWILWAFWSWIDDRFAPIYERMLGRPVAGLGFLTAVVLIILMGIVARNVAGRRVPAFRERW